MEATPNKTNGKTPKVSDADARGNIQHCRLFMQ